MQVLFVLSPNWCNQASAFGELLQKGFRNGGRGGCNQNYVVRTRLRPTERAVAAVDVDVYVAEALQPFGGRLRQIRQDFDGVDLSCQERSDGSLIAAPSADFQNIF